RTRRRPIARDVSPWPPICLSGGPSMPRAPHRPPRQDPRRTTPRGQRSRTRTTGLVLLVSGLVAASAVILALLPTAFGPRSELEGIAPHAPAPIPGTELRLTLAEPRAQQYGPQDLRPEDAERAAAVRAAGGVWDPALAHAARALVRHYAK